MGISGLLPFLEKSSRRANVKEYAGQTVAIDAYCWLHKGAFSCAEKLVMKEPTNMYVMYCMKFINMLLSHNIKPILVFDGRRLAAKSSTEKKRRESREVNRKKGADLLRAGRVEEGRSYLRRSVDITHDMALRLMKEARARNVDCVVAPHEADAQLAYLNLSGIAQVIITEDSDLLCFGCEKVLFKMDINGNGSLVEKDKLHLSMGLRPDLFSLERFRHMCILSGCDYLDSLPGIGLGKACKFFARVSENDVFKALQKLPGNLNMWTLVVSDEYRERFVAADRAFRYQLVYDPLKRCQVPLTPGTKDDVVGELLDERTAFDLALGNIDPGSMKRVDDFHPDRAILNNKTDRFTQRAPHPSIWSKNYVPKVVKAQSPRDVLRMSTAGMSHTTDVTLAVKRSSEVDASIKDDDLLRLYGGQVKRSREEREKTPESEERGGRGVETSPVLSCRNPFAVRRRRQMMRRGSVLDKFTSQNSAELCSSRYFSSQSSAGDLSQTSAISTLDESFSATTQSELDLNEFSTLECTNKKGVEEDSLLSLSTTIIDDESLLSNPNPDVESFTSSGSLNLKRFTLEKHQEEEITQKSSQEENCSLVSNSSEPGEEKSKFRIFCEKQISKTTNQTTSSESPGDDTSIFFESQQNVSCRPKSQNHSLFTGKFCPKEMKSLPKSTKKSGVSVGLSRPKQQTLLSMFKFQQRPKI